MKKYFFIFFFFTSLYSQTTISGSVIHDGTTRTYSFYVPASYTPGNPVSLVIGLHGLSSSGAQFAQYRDFKPIADTANFIMVNPDGTSLFGVKYWNYGITGSSPDDVGFLEALIDTISAHYSINQQRVYCTGMSNGSFMSYYMACQTNRFAAIGGVTGSMSTDMYTDCTPSYPIPQIHIHGTADGTNPYAGTSTMVGIDELTRFWVEQNNCDTIPTILNIPDINTGDGATAIRYLYEGGTNANTVELFKVIGGEHTWPGGPMPGSSDITCMDFNASVEIWRFFSQYELPASISIEENSSSVDISIWPNPTYHVLYIQSSKHLVKEITIMDMQGKILERINQENLQSVDVSHLNTGTYFILISGEEFCVVKKVVVIRE